MATGTEVNQGSRDQQTFRVELETPEGLRRIVCGDDEYVWDAAFNQGLLLPAICHQGRCLTCAGMLLSGAVYQGEANMYFPEDEAAGFVLLCRARARADLCIRTHQEWEMRAHRLTHGLPAPYS